MSGGSRTTSRDATDLADMLRLGRLPEAWIAPPAVRELRELVRYRAKLVQLRSGLKAQVHAVMAKEGVLPSVRDMFGPAGQLQLDEMGLGHGYTIRVESLRDLIEIYDREIVMLEREIHRRLRRPPRLSGDAGDQRGRAHHRGDLRRRDRRRHPVPDADGAVLVGRAHPASRESDTKGHDAGHHQDRARSCCAGR